MKDTTICKVMIRYVYLTLTVLTIIVGTTSCTALMGGHEILLAPGIGPNEGEQYPTLTCDKPDIYLWDLDGVPITIKGWLAGNIKHPELWDYKFKMTPGPHTVGVILTRVTSALFTMVAENSSVIHITFDAKRGSAYLLVPNEKTSWTSSEHTWNPKIIEISK
jgi:hypothetical protein